VIGTAGTELPGTVGRAVDGAAVEGGAALVWGAGLVATCGGMKQHDGVVGGGPAVVVVVVVVVVGAAWLT